MKDFDKITERINVRNRIAADYFKDKPEVKTDDLYSVISRNPIYYEGGDGTHPNALGVKALANRVADEILTSLNESSNLTYFPAGYTPEEVGKKLGYHFLQSKHYFPDQERIVYPEVCTCLLRCCNRTLRRAAQCCRTHDTLQVQHHNCTAL